jgi:hypothetical protein
MQTQSGMDDLVLAETMSVVDVVSDVAFRLTSCCSLRRLPERRVDFEGAGPVLESTFFDSEQYSRNKNRGRAT